MKNTTLIGWALSLAITAAGSWLATAWWLGRDLPDPAIQQRSLHSVVLGEARTYFVHLPDSYARAPAQRYPVVYVLDGTSQSMHTAASADLMARIGAMPETIVVGIPSGEARARDYTPPGMHRDGDEANAIDGEADRFLAFLQRELVPRVEREFRTRRERVLAGNSRGGLFVVYALTASPNAFDAWIANSPAMWRDDGAMVRRLEAFLRSHRDLHGALFLSLGGSENAKMTAAFRRTLAVLHEDAPAGLQWRSSITPGATHEDNARKATPIALQWLQPPGPATAPTHPGGSPPHPANIGR